MHLFLFIVLHAELVLFAVSYLQIPPSSRFPWRHKRLQVGTALISSQQMLLFFLIARMGRDAASASPLVRRRQKQTDSNVSLPLCLSLSLSLCLSLCLSLSLSVSLPFRVAAIPPVSFPVSSCCLSLSLSVMGISVSLCLLYVFECLSVSLSVSLFVSLSVYVSSLLSVRACICLCLFVSLSLCLFVSLSLCLSVSLSLSLS